MAKKSRAPNAISIGEFDSGSRTNLRWPLYQDALGSDLEVPFIVVRGTGNGPTVGISAAVHGNELNGIRIIHSLLEDLDPAKLHGSLICAPVVNVPAYEVGQRRFPEDDVDLNHVFPGSTTGTPSQQYARSFARTFLPACDYLIDIHTASEGRVNTMYVRADLESPTAREMAMYMEPEIILHGRSGDGTLRSAARRRDIHAITVEAGNPSVIQGRMVSEGEIGVRRVLARLGVLPPGHDEQLGRVPVICRASKWLRTTHGGLVEYHIQLADRIQKGQLLARIHDIFGIVRAEYRAPRDGIVIGRSQRPDAVPGIRFCHLGEIGDVGQGDDG
jgi:predicted deacylase